MIPLTSPLFDYVGKRFDAIDIHPTVFQSAKPKIAAESLYLYANDAGIQLALTKRTFLVSAIFLFAEGVEKCRQYVGDVPCGLRFAQMREDVRTLLGAPAISMNAGGEGIMAIAHDFDRYETDTHYLRVEFFKGAGIRLITIGAV